MQKYSVGDVLISNQYTKRMRIEILSINDSEMSSIYGEDVILILTESGNELVVTETLLDAEGFVLDDESPNRKSK